MKYSSVIFLFCLTVSLVSFSQSHVDGVAATVNGEVITFSEIRQELSRMQAQAPVAFSKQQQELGRMGLFRMVAGNLIEEELLFAEVENRKINLPKDYLDQRMQGLVDERFGGDWKKFTASLLDSGQTLEDYRDIVGRQLGARLLVDEVVNRSVVVTARDIASYYAAHTDQFHVPERIRLSVIFLSRKPGADQADLDRRMARVKKELEQGTPFETVAKSYSADSTAEAGGDLGWQALSNLSELYRNAAGNLPAGSLSPVITEPGGAHLLKVVDREPPRVLPLNTAVKKQIQTVLFQQRRDALYQKFIAELREKYYVKNFLDEAIPPEK